jgi:hypothetical protein
MQKPVGHVAHLNVARLRALPGDPLVAEFIDNVDKVNAVAERSPGFVWRWTDEAARVSSDLTFEALFNDPLMAALLSVWETVADLQHFVQRTVHGGFVRRRETWFEPAVGPAYVLWMIEKGQVPTLSEGCSRLARLAELGPTDQAFDFTYSLKSAE